MKLDMEEKKDNSIGSNVAVFHELYEKFHAEEMAKV